MSDFEERVASEIRRFVLEDHENRMTGVDNSPFFDEPLVGFASGDDPIFRELKCIIGDFHHAPEEIMTRHCMNIGGDVPLENEIGVISFVLPISEATRRENALMRDGPSERWSHTRLFGEMFNKRLQRHLVSRLEEMGHMAVAPELTESFRTVDDERVGKASTWSQRHVAFACGLGTFGLSDGLITARGKAHRIGSVVVNFPLRSPERQRDIHAACIFFNKGGCKVCAKRCPVDAISEKGHDKVKCSEFVYGQADTIRERYGIEIYGCGLCQTGVPCEHVDPVSEGEADD